MKANFIIQVVLLSFTLTLLSCRSTYRLDFSNKQLVEKTDIFKELKLIAKFKKCSLYDVCTPDTIYKIDLPICDINMAGILSAETIREQDCKGKTYGKHSIYLYKYTYNKSFSNYILISGRLEERLDDKYVAPIFFLIGEQDTISNSPNSIKFKKRYALNENSFNRPSKYNASKKKQDIDFTFFYEMSIKKDTLTITEVFNNVKDSNKFLNSSAFNIKDIINHYLELTLLKPTPKNSQP